jgi:hypothetical protein
LKRVILQWLVIAFVLSSNAIAGQYHVTTSGTSGGAGTMSSIYTD